MCQNTDTDGGTLATFTIGTGDLMQWPSEAAAVILVVIAIVTAVIQLLSYCRNSKISSCAFKKLYASVFHFAKYPNIRKKTLILAQM